MIFKNYEKYLAKLFLKNIFIISIFFIFLSFFLNIFEEIKFSETSVYFTEDTAFGCFRAIGTMKDGTKVDHRGIDIYKFRGGKISVKDSYWKRIF